MSIESSKKWILKAENDLKIAKDDNLSQHYRT